MERAEKAGFAVKAGYAGVMKPGPLLTAFERNMADPNILSLRPDVALVAAEIEGVLSGLTPVDVSALPGAVAGVEAAIRSRDGAQVVLALDALKQKVEALTDSQVSQNKLIELREHKARLAKVEHMRAVAAATMVDAATVWALIYTVIDLVRAHVSDGQARHAIAEGLVRVVGRDALPRID